MEEIFKNIRKTSQDPLHDDDNAGIKGPKQAVQVESNSKWNHVNGQVGFPVHVHQPSYALGGEEDHRHNEIALWHWFCLVLFTLLMLGHSFLVEGDNWLVVEDCIDEGNYKE